MSSPVMVPRRMMRMAPSCSAVTVSSMRWGYRFQLYVAMGKS